MRRFTVTQPRAHTTHSCRRRSQTCADPPSACAAAPARGRAVRLAFSHRHPSRTAAWAWPAPRRRVTRQRGAHGSAARAAARRWHPAQPARSACPPAVLPRERADKVRRATARPRTGGRWAKVPKQRTHKPRCIQHAYVSVRRASRLPGQALRVAGARPTRAASSSTVVVEHHPQQTRCVVHMFVQHAFARQLLRAHQRTR